MFSPMSMNTERSGLCCENSNCRICPVRFSRQVYIRAGSKFGGAHQKTPEDATRTAEIDWEHVSQKWNIYALPHQKHRLSCCRPKPISENTSIFVLITTVLHHPTKQVPTKFKIFLLATISSHNRLSRHVLVGMAACNNERLLIP